MTVSECDILKAQKSNSSLTDPQIQTLGTEHIVVETDIDDTVHNLVASHPDIVLNKGVSQTYVAAPCLEPAANQPTTRATQSMDEQSKKRSSNPFLPEHVVQELRKVNQNLVQEIAQSSEALNASAALMRTYQQNAPSRLKFEERGESYNQKRAERYKLVDELVQEYLPLIAADLRRKLRSQIDRELHDEPA